MNLFEKIQAVRVDLQNSNLKMTGKNTYAKYDYFELSDFLKPLNELMLKHKMTAIPTFTKETATLIAINCEDVTERFEITSPFSNADLKGCHEVQIVGAVETYQRRYLYQALFDIAESDGLNATQGKPQEEKKQPQKSSEKPASRKESEKQNADLPFPEQAQATKTKSSEELKAERQAKLMEFGAKYYPECSPEMFTNVLKAIAKNSGKKFSEMTKEEFETVLSDIERRAY